MNAAVKSGTNQFHGSVYEFLRSDKLDARNFFDAQKPSFRQNQYGYSFGGPIFKDKTFFFTNYEAFRVRRGRSFLGTVPDSKQLTGDFTALSRPVYDPATTRVDPANAVNILRDAFPGNVIPANRIHSYAKLFNTLLPPPNAVGSFNYIRVGTDLNDADQFNARLDHRFSGSDSVF